MKQRSQQAASRQLLPTEVPGAFKPVPRRALWISFLALAAATVGAFTHPDFLAGYDALSWLLILIPAFLLAYYRGWVGATRALAAGTVFVLLAELVAERLFGFSVNWSLLFLTAVVLLAVGTGLGVLSELLERERRDALVLAYSDTLTGLPNRQLLDFVLEKEFAAARRGRPVSIVFFHVDGLDAYNASHGRQAGDDALRRIGARLEEQMRTMNVAGRYSGAEFMAILSGENAGGAWVFTDRVREAITKLALPTGESLTVSAGVTSYEPWMRNQNDLVRAAYKALGRARSRGGNCTVVETAYTDTAELPASIADLSEDEQAALERSFRRQSLEEAEKRYRNLFNRVPVGLYRASPSGQVIDANPALVRMLGYPDRETLLSVDARDVYADPEERRRWQARIEADGVVRGYEIQLRRYDGTTIWVRDNARAVLGWEGAVRYYEGVLEEITERKQAEEEVRAANEKLRAVIEAAPLAVISLDAEGKVLSWNPSAERLFGWKESEVLGRPFPAVSDEHRDEFASLLACVLRGELIAGVEVQRQKRDGSMVDLQLWAAPLYDSQGSVTGAMGVLTDVTEQKRVQQAYLLLATAVEQGGEAILITDVAGTIRYVNPAFERITGYSRDEAVGKDARLLNSGKHDESFFKEMWDTISSGEVWTGRLTNKKKDGTLFLEDLMISPVRDGSGKISHYVGIGRDVTHEAELEEQLRHSQKMEAVGKLAGGIAHDFNNLLTAILVNVEMLRTGVSPTDSTREALEEIGRAGERAAELTRQLLAFSRRQVLEPELLDLNTAIRDISKMIGRIIGENIDLRTVLDPKLGRVNADKGQIEQVIVNLAVNARDAMPEGGVFTIETTNVDLDAEYAAGHPPVEPGPFVLMTFSDTGVGVDESIKSRIFEPFFTTKRVGEGTGLGLSTVYGIVKQSQGFIWVYSEPGHGTTFKVYLPRVAGPATEAESAETSFGTASLRGSETVLLVEDEAAVLAVARRTLENSGYKILEAPNATQALRIAEKYPASIDVLITDMVMPDMNGKELADRVSKLRPDIKVLFMSGYSDQGVVSNGMLQPGKAFLAKPFTQEALLTKLREVLGALQAG